MIAQREMTEGAETQALARTEQKIHRREVVAIALPVAVRLRQRVIEGAHAAAVAEVERVVARRAAAAEKFVQCRKWIERGIDEACIAQARAVIEAIDASEFARRLQ